MVKKSGYISLIIFIFLFSFSLSAQNYLGMNLTRIVDYSSAWTFTDRMKHARAWIPYDLDGSGVWDSGVAIPKEVSSGYPLAIPYDPDGVGGIKPQGVKTLLFRGIIYPRGTYTLIFDGTGAVQLGIDASGTYYNDTDSIDSTYDFVITNPTVGGGLLLSIIESSAGDPIRNIRVIMPGFKSTYKTQIFHPGYLDILRDYSFLRFMWWGQVCNSDVVNWVDRKTTEYYTQAGANGVAPEYMVELSNELDSDPWICIPHQADDEYIRNLAVLFRDNLNSDRKIFLEYTNETWNGIYEQTWWCQEQGKALSLDSDNFRAGLLYYAKRSAEVFRIFEDEFGSDSRVICVIASQAANFSIGKIIMSWFDNNPTDKKPEAFAIAPYFGHSIPNNIVTEGKVDSITINDIIKRLDRDVMDNTAIWTAQNYKKIANEYNIPLIAYEGGEHMVPNYTNMENNKLIEKLHATARSPLMEDVYVKMFSAWKQNGGTYFAIFDDIGLYSKYGTFSMLESQEQSLSSAPKYQAIQEILTDGYINNINLKSFSSGLKFFQ